MPAVLRLSGRRDQLQQSLHGMPLRFVESIASQRRRAAGESCDDEITTFNLTISDADGDRVPEQIRDSSLFLSQNEDAVGALQRLPGVEHLCVDFSWDFPQNGIGQYNRFSCLFLKQCSTLGIDIQVSVYSTSRCNDLE